MKGQKDNTKRKKNSSGQYFPLYNTVMTEEQVGYNSSPLSFFICWAEMMTYNGPHSYLAKLEESESAEKMSCLWYPW